MSHRDETVADASPWRKVRRRRRSKPADADRLRFSLRALLILFTVAIVYVGWNLRRLEERKERRESAAARGAYIVTYAENFSLKGPNVNRVRPAIVALGRARSERTIEGAAFIDSRPRAGAGLPVIRRIFGDEAVYIIILTDEHELAAIRNAFPESYIVVDPTFLLPSGL